MNKLQANLCLLCVTFCWSTEVIIFACIPNEISPFATTSITFLVGGAILVMAFFRRIREGLKDQCRRQLLRCIFLSIMNSAYNTMFQFGLKDFDVYTGAFTLSLTVVALPIIMIIQRAHVEKRTWISSSIVLFGITVALWGMLSGQNISGLSVIVAGCALRAFYIMKLNQYAREHDPIVLSAMICVSGGIISYFFWMAVQPGTFFVVTWTSTVIASLAIYAYFVVAFTITINIFAQRRATPASATIIYSLEIVFSIIWGTVMPAHLIDQANLTPGLIVGMVCVVVGNIVEIVDLPLLDREREVTG